MNELGWFPEYDISRLEILPIHILIQEETIGLFCFLTGKLDSIETLAVRTRVYFFAVN